MSDVDPGLRAAAAAAIGLVNDGARVGLGTGRAAAAFIALLGERVQDGLRVSGVATSEESARQAEALGIRLVGLDEEARRRPLRQYSKGMVQRVGLAQALINDPELVILDEPMSGLDPLGRREVREIILALRDEGRTGGRRPRSRSRARRRRSWLE